jgi:hypothetical protein
MADTDSTPTIKPGQVTAADVPGAAPTADTTASTPAIALTDEQKKKLAEATGPIWKTVLWWVLGFFGVLAGAIGLLYVLKGKGPVNAVKESVQTSKNEIAKSDLDAKIKVAEAENMEKAVIDKLKEIKEIPDEKKRLDELTKLL